MKMQSFYGLSYLTSLLIVLCMIVTGCATDPGSYSGEADIEGVVAGVPQSDQMLFDSPETAAGVLKDAAMNKDTQTLEEIFGGKGRDLIFSGDPVADAARIDKFAEEAAEHLHVDRSIPEKAVLYLGKTNWAFPIPLVPAGDKWFFDIAIGAEELINRRIGENELNAISISRGYVRLQKDYASRDRMGDGISQYAQRIMSTPGKKDGLYWEPQAGEDLSPVGPLIANARLEGYSLEEGDKPEPYHGYYFKVLTAQGDAAPGGRKSYIVNGRMTGGFALVACPAEWGNSGVMTFIVNQEGKVHQKSLGEKTLEIVVEMTEYNPDSTWDEVRD